MSEGLKQARERAARGYAQPGDPRFVRKAIEDELRELQRQAMVALAEYMRGYAGGTDTAIDALLDGTAPEGE